MTAAWISTARHRAAQWAVLLMGVLCLAAGSAWAQLGPSSISNFGPDQYLEALARGNLEGVQRGINGGRPINEVFTDGSNALITAAKGGHVAIVNFLLENRAHLDFRDRGQNTAIAWAADRGHTETVAALLKAGADANVPDRAGDTPLIKATKGGFIDVARVLVEKKVDLTRTDNTGLTALDWAERNRQPGIARLLRGAGAK